MNITDPEWLSKIKNLSKIPDSCNFWIFCNKTNTFIEKSLKPVKNSNVLMYVCLNLLIQSFKCSILFTQSAFRIPLLLLSVIKMHVMHRT